MQGAFKTIICRLHSRPELFGICMIDHYWLQHVAFKCGIMDAPFCTLGHLGMKVFTVAPKE